MHETGVSVEQVAEQFDLTPGQVHAALSYYYDHRQKIQQEIMDSEIEADQYRKNGQAVETGILQARIDKRGRGQ